MNTDSTVTDYDGCSNSPSTSYVQKLEEETDKVINKQRSLL